MLELIGLVLGLLYLYWEYRADRRVWLVGVVMPLNSLFVYWRAGLYADFGINIYYLLIAIYGYWRWRYGRKNPKGGGARELPIRRTPWQAWPLLALAAGGLYVLLVWLLLRFTNSTVPYWDALNTALSIVALWMMTRKWAEQWLVWLVVDAVSTGLYFHKDIPFYGVLYAVYTVVAWFGYREWLRRMRATN